MSKPLFRREAVAEHRGRVEGDVLLVTSPTTRLLTLSLLVCIACAVVFLASNTFTRKEKVSGWLTPDKGIVRVVASSGGTVTELHVSEQDIVAAGDPIATLRLSSATLEGDFGSTIERILEEEVDASREEASASIDEMRFRQQRLKGLQEGLHQELQGIERETNLLKARADLANSELERIRASTASGLTTITSLEASELRAIEAQLAVASMEREATQLENRIAEVEADILIMPLQEEQLVARTRIGSANLEEKAARLDISNSYVVVSPVNGRMELIAQSVGQTLGPDRPIGIIAPLDSRLFAELFVPSRAAGFIKIGQDVRLRYEAFPHQTFGAGHGTVASVSRTVLSPEEVSLPAAQLTEPVFRVIVEIQSESVSAYGEDIPLRAGMLLSADVEIDERTLLRWLLDPIYAIAKL